MKRIATYLIILGGVITTPSQVFSQDSLLLRSYLFVKQQDPWLTNQNAAALTRFKAKSISEAELSLSHAKGGFTDYYESPKVLQFDVAVESFYRLSSRTVVFGSVHYDNFSGHDMAGSAFINPTRLPFNIVEDSLTNTGKKHRDTYQLSGAIGVDLWKGLSLGARLEYTSANIAKYKDLRHKNSYMNLNVSAGFYVPIGPFNFGANYQYRRTTETIRFSTYGTNDKVYKSLIDYANFTGHIEQFGESGFTDNSREMPLLDNYHGIGIQLGWNICRTLYFFHSFNTSWRDGYYGRKSPYTITYTNHESHIYDYQANLMLKTRYQQHTLSLNLNAENLENLRSSYQELTNDAGAYYYEYYSPLKTASKLWVNTALKYTADLGIREELPTWTLSAALRLFHRKQTAYGYPYLRRQKLDNTEISVSAERNILTKKGVVTLHLDGSYLYGSGEPYEDATFIAPSDKQTPPPEMTVYLWREYQWLTSAQYVIGGYAKYGFIFPQTRLKTYVKAAISHRKANETNSYSAGKDHTTLQIAIGCTF